MKKLLIITSIACFVRLGSAQVTLDVVSFGGAIANDEFDDREAIQKTMDAVNLAGGGTVTFPAGVFMISKLPDSDPIQVICLQIYSNMLLKGAGRDSTIIRLMPGSGDFDAMISCKPSWETIRNFQLIDLTLDENGSNNSTPTQSGLNNYGSRSVFRLYLGSNITIEHCRFTNIKGVWGAVFNGIMDTVTVNDVIFSNIGDPYVDWDHSTIYTHGDNFTITNNQFYSLNGAGTLGARTAIETHGSNQYVANNIIRGMTQGMNITGYTNHGYSSYNQTIYNNTIQDALYGFILWSGPGDNPDIETGLQDVLIEDNYVELNPAAWTRYQYYSGASALYFESNRERDAQEIYVIDNIIRFVNSSEVPDAEITSGMIMHPNSVSGVQVRNFYFLNNRIENSFGPGIFLDDKLEKAIFSGNELIDCGSAENLPNEAFRSGFYLAGSSSDLYISDNLVNDDLEIPVLKRIIHDGSYNTGNGLIYNNTSNVETAVPLYEGPGQGGQDWITEPQRPTASLSTDSLRINRNSTDQSLEVRLSRPAADTLSAALFLHDFMVTERSLFNLPDTLVVFYPGDSIKNVTIEVLDNEKLKGKVSAELILAFSNETYPARHQHCRIRVPALNLDDDPPSIPGGLKLFGLGMNEFTLAWSPSSDNNEVSGYDIYINQVLHAVTNEDTSLLIFDLKPYETYQVTIVARDAADNYSAPSESLAVTTLEDNQPPTVPNDLIAKFITKDRFLLQWALSLDNDRLDRYQVFVDGVLYNQTAEMKMTISGLQPGTTYATTVVAFDKTGNESDPSATLFVTTTGNPTSLPEAGAIKDIAVYPIPARDLLFIEGADNHSLIRIYTLDGTRVKEAAGAQFIRVSDLESGYYLIEIQKDERIHRLKFVKE